MAVSFRFPHGTGRSLLFPPLPPAVQVLLVEIVQPVQQQILVNEDLPLAVFLDEAALPPVITTVATGRAASSIRWIMLSIIPALP